MSFTRFGALGVLATLVVACGAPPDGESQGRTDDALARVGADPTPVNTVSPPPPPPPGPPSPQSRMTSTYCPTVHPSCKIGVTGAPFEMGPGASLIQMGFDCSLDESYDAGPSTQTTTTTIGGIALGGSVGRVAASTYSDAPQGSNLYFTICKETPALDALIKDGSVYANLPIGREPNACDACVPVAKDGYVYVMYGADLAVIAADGTLISYEPYCGSGCLLAPFPPRH
jgi:hypothetical protein